MKNIFPKIAAMTIAVSFLVLLIPSCTVEDLTKDLTIYTGTNFLVNPISIQVADAAHLEEVPEGLTVSIEGRDKNKFYSLLGQRKIQAVYGIIALAVKTQDAPTEANPLEFTLVLSAPNYMPIRKNYVVTKNAELETEQIAMTNLLSLPSGVSVENTSFASTTATGVTQDLTINSPISAKKVEQACVKINGGTQILAADGSFLTGAIQAQLVHHDAHSEASLGGISENFGDLSVKIGSNTVHTMVKPAGFYSLTMTTNDKNAAKFSQPLDVTMDIDPNYFSGVYNRKIKEGDELDVLSRTETETAWTIETKASVVSVNGRLKARFKQAHLSIWVVGEVTKMQDICRTQLKINSDLPTWFGECTARATYGYKVVNAQNMNIIYKEGKSSFNNCEILDDNVLSDNKIDVVFIVFNINSAGGQMVYMSPPQNLCNNPSINLIGKLPVNKNVVANINVSGLCTSSTGINTVLVPNNVNVWYRNINAPTNVPFGGWAPLVNVVDGKGCAKGLVAGESYDFALPIVNNDNEFQQTFAKCLKQPNGLKVPVSGDFVLEIKSPVYNVYQTFVIKKMPDGVYDIGYQNCPIPANICRELDNRFSTFIVKK